MVAKSRKDSTVEAATPGGANKVAKVNGIAKKNKKLKNVAKEATAIKASKIDAVQNAPTGKHIVFDDDDRPVAASAKKISKKRSKEDVKDIGKRWYEEVNVTRPHEVHHYRDFFGSYFVV